MADQQREPVQVRRARVTDAAGIARAHIDSWRTTYTGIVPDAYLAQLSYERRERFWTDAVRTAEPGSRVFVAEDASGQIVGFASGGPERSGDPTYRAELYAIYILHSHQRQGIGHRLFQAVVEHVAERGMDRMLLWVLADNPSRRFYEALGGHPVRSQTVEIGGAVLVEVAYGWDDLSALHGHQHTPDRF